MLFTVDSHVAYQGEKHVACNRNSGCTDCSSLKMMLISALVCPILHFHETIYILLGCAVLRCEYVRMQSIQNLGLALVVMVNGIIVDEKGYFILEISMLAWLCGECGIFLTVSALINC